MVPSHVTPAIVLEGLVVLFQVAGIAALCLTRLWPGGRWAWRGKVAFVFALIGLGIAGALCGRHDSVFALFAGGTMTILLIGMTAGSSTPDSTATPIEARGSEPAWIS